MTKMLISGIIGLIMCLNSFNVYIAKFIKNEESVVTSSIVEESELAEKNFDIDVEITDENVESIEEKKEEKQEIPTENIVIKENENQQQEVKNNKTVEQENSVKSSNVENKIIKTESENTTTQKLENKTEVKTENKITNTAKINNNTNNQTTNNNQQNTQSVNTQIEVSSQKEEQVQQTQESTENTQVKQEESKPVQEVVQQPKIEVKRNDEMIQKIKTYISTHETERMKKYGYSFVVDPNVVNYTNPFTYSEYNMATCLDLTGEIRIYARDYFYNGKFVETQCFVY